ncbi:MAG TPA: amino acid ABC transporter permease [Candidatus Limnocylindria bacterium]|nr:amino acid ABC transporter permease [Candidatus Limnocylindria bacterium]
MSAGTTAGAPVVPYVDPVRAAALRRRGRRNGWLSSVSTLVVFAVLILVVVTAPGWPAVKETFFNPEAFAESAPKVLRAFLLNVKIFLIAEPLILVVALAIALMRGLRGPVFLPFRLLAAVWTDVFRGIPTILLIYLFGFGIPALGIAGLTKSYLFWGTVALVCSYSAYVAEVYRAGIDSVHPSQRAAARSLGLSGVQTVRFVVLPQAVRRVVPPLLNDFISLQKDTALVSVLGPIEALRAAGIYASFNFNYTSYVVAALLFIALTIPLARFTDALLARDRKRQLAGGTA